MNTDYKTLYYYLFNQLSDLIDQAQNAQLQAEAIYAGMSDHPLPSRDPQKENDPV